jgi:hypothetical protein
MEQKFSRISAVLPGHPRPVRQDPRKCGTIPTETEMKSTKMAQPTQSTRREPQNLEVRYGEIGISAVVAAMRYQGDARIAAPVLTRRQPDRWLQELISEIA